LLLPQVDNRPPPPPQTFTVHPDNWLAFMVFRACQTQWRMVVGMSGALYQGLDYPSVLAVLDAWKVKKRKKVFRQIVLIETGALSVIHDE
jgi:hypothetical protein